jgi:hypothetical protein
MLAGVATTTSQEAVMRFRALALPFALVAACAIAGAPAVTKDAKGRYLIATQDQTLSTTPYNHFTVMVRSADGALHAVYYSGPEHGQLDENEVKSATLLGADYYIHSGDDGASWSTPVKLFPAAEHEAIDQAQKALYYSPRVGVAGGSTLVVLTSRVAPRTSGKCDAAPDLKQKVLGWCRSEVRRVSTDAGKTWGPEEEISFANAPAHGTVLLFGELRQLPDSHDLVGVAFVTGNGGTHVLQVVRSADLGKSWTLGAPFYTGKRGDKAYPDVSESSLLPLDEKRWLVIARVDGRVGTDRQLVTTDGGAHWNDLGDIDGTPGYGVAPTLERVSGALLFGAGKPEAAQDYVLLAYFDRQNNFSTLRLAPVSAVLTSASAWSDREFVFKPALYDESAGKSGSNQKSRSGYQALKVDPKDGDVTIINHADTTEPGAKVQTTRMFTQRFNLRDLGEPYAETLSRMKLKP